jgi:large subunit ribosomal protein L29
MNQKEINERLDALKDSLLKERASVAMGGAPKNPGKIRSLRRQIARIMTVESEGKRNE